MGGETCAPAAATPSGPPPRRRGDLAVDLERAAEVGWCSATRSPASEPCSGARERPAGVAERQRHPRVGPGDHREQQREVADVAGQRAADRGGLPLVVQRATPAPGRARAAGPTTPQNDAGLRREPPMSEPSASGTMPAASARRRSPAGAAGGPARVVRVAGGAEDPVEGVGAGRELRHVGLADEHRAGARGSARRSGRRASGTWSANSGEPYVVRHPATSWVSLTANGSPCSGPSGRRGPGARRRPRRRRGPAPRRATRSR